MYVKSMEVEVLRLQDEWAAVLQEIARATEENLILKRHLEVPAVSTLFSNKYTKCQFRPCYKLF
jgi:hypothetical protein